MINKKSTYPKAIYQYRNFMTYVFIGESRSRSRLFLLSMIFLTWTNHKQKWLIQILGLKLSQNRSQDRFGTWYVHVKEIFDKRKKAWKKLALHRGSTGFRSQIWQQTHMHGAVSVEPNYIEVHKLRYWLKRNQDSKQMAKLRDLWNVDLRRTANK